MLNIEGQTATLYNGLGPAQTSNCFFEPNSFRTVAALLYLIVMVAGVGAKRLPTASNFQRLCLRNLWMAIPRESRRSHVPMTAKALLTNVVKKRNLIKRSLFHHCGTIIYCACVVQTIKKSKRYFYNGKSYRKALSSFYFECTEKKFNFCGLIFS